MSPKFLSLLIAVLLGASADSAFAAIDYNASKSNSLGVGGFTYDPKVDLNGPKLCADGGTIKPGPGKARSGRRVRALLAPAVGTGLF